MTRISKRWRSRDELALPLDAVEALQQAHNSPGILVMPGGT